MPVTRLRGAPRPLLAALVLLVLCAVVVFLNLAGGYERPFAAPTDDTGDLALYGRIVDQMRHGQNYYVAAHAELLNGAYGTRSVFNWRLPALPWLASLAPSLFWAGILLQLAATAAILLTFRWLDQTAGRAVALLAVAALVVSLAASAAPGVAVFADVVAGVLIVLSASAYGTKLPWLGFAAALCALFVRELAAPYVVICVFLAWRGGRRQELWAWALGLAAFAAYFAWHYAQVQAQLGPADVAYAEGWVQFGGLPFVLATGAFNGLLIAAPTWVSAILLPLALLGLVAWRDPAASRIVVTVGAYVALFLFVGKSFNEYWGALYTPLMMLGVAFVPSAVRDVLAAFSGQSAAPKAAVAPSPLP